MFRLLRAEGIKTLRDRTFWWSLAGLAGSPAMVTAMFLFGKSDMIKRGVWTIPFFTLQTVQMQALLLGPMMIALIGTNLVMTEYRLKMIKSLIPLPVSMPGLFLAKAFWGACGVFLGMQLTGLLTVHIPLLFGLEYGPAVPYSETLATVLQDQALMAAVLIASLLWAMLIGTVTKNFVIPLATSMVTHIGGLLAIQGDKGHFFWTALPLLAVHRQDAGIGMGRFLGPAAAFAAAFTTAAVLWIWLSPRPE